ncbi:hypothetical protein N9164_13325, partial [Draconibacterium sp.]|nr:hypothetical protein [Draconibacterium sp.]
MEIKEKYSKWMFILFPAIAMMLGWGLRGHIGGGPFGAMIPGAMVALTICMLLEIPAAFTSLIVVFGVVGIGLGGEMTYGQTLGFLRNPETVWWGILATTIKGAVWGVLGGAVLSIGFIFKNLSKKTIIVSLLIMMAGMLLGFKLINQPMLIYFSNPANPRPESWAALLFGAIALLIYLKFKITKENFLIISRFSLWGLIGGGLGFGIGGLWMVMGSRMPEGIVFHAWWKAMEFTFGLLLGAALGFAAWISRKDLQANWEVTDKVEGYSLKTSYKEIGVMLLAGLLIFAIIPFSLEPFMDAASESDGFILAGFRSLVMMLVNYAFYGLILIAAALYFPKAAWQIGITLTFCHTVIDLADDHLVEIFSNSTVVASVLTVLLATLVVGLLVAYYQGKSNK